MRANPLRKKINAGLFSRCVSRCVLIRNNPPIDAEGPASPSSKPQAEELPPDDVIEPEESEPAPDLDRVDDEVDRDYTHNLVGRLVKAEYWGARGTKYWATGEILWYNETLQEFCVMFDEETDDHDYLSQDDLDGSDVKLLPKKAKGKSKKY